MLEFKPTGGAVVNYSNAHAWDLCLGKVRLGLSMPDCFVPAAFVAATSQEPRPPGSRTRAARFCAGRRVDPIPFADQRWNTEQAHLDREDVQSCHVGAGITTVEHLILEL